MKKTLVLLIVSFFLAAAASAVALPYIPGTDGEWGPPNGGYYHSEGCMASCPHGSCTWVRPPGTQEWGTCYCSITGYPYCHGSLTSGWKFNYMTSADRASASAKLAAMSQAVVTQMGPKPSVFDLQDSLVDLSNEVLYGDDASVGDAIGELEGVLGGMTAGERQQVHQIAVSVLGTGLTSP